MYRIAKTTVFLVWPAVLACARDIPVRILVGLERLDGLEGGGGRVGRETYRRRRVRNTCREDIGRPFDRRDLCVEERTRWLSRQWGWCTQ
jgi:hypothetical protein